MAFAGVALSADTGASFLLPRLVGQGRASRMMLLGEKVDAGEALRIGMVDEVVADADLAAAVGAPGRSAGRRADHGVRLDQGVAAPRRVRPTWNPPWTFEDRAQAACFASPDHREAIQAFVRETAAEVHRKLSCGQPRIRCVAGHPSDRPGRRTARSSGRAVALPGGTDG